MDGAGWNAQIPWKKFPELSLCGTSRPEQCQEKAPAGQIRWIESLEQGESNPWLSLAFQRGEVHRDVVG